MALFLLYTQIVRKPTPEQKYMALPTSQQAVRPLLFKTLAGLTLWFLACLILVFIVSNQSTTEKENHQTADNKSAQEFDVLQNTLKTLKMNEVQNDVIKSLRKEKSLSTVDRSVLLGISAARNLEISGSKIGVNIGSSRGATGIWEAAYDRFRESKYITSRNRFGAITWSQNFSGKTKWEFRRCFWV